VDALTGRPKDQQKGPGQRRISNNGERVSAEGGPSRDSKLRSDQN